MRDWAEQNKGFVLSLLIIIVSCSGAFFLVQGKTDSALAQCERNKQHIEQQEKGRAEVIKSISVIETKVGYIEKSLDAQTKIQQSTAAKLERMSEALLKFMAREDRRGGGGNN